MICEENILIVILLSSIYLCLITINYLFFKFSHMRKLLFAICAGMALFLTGCQEKVVTPEQETGFSLDQEVVDVTAEGGVMVVTWKVENPIEGAGVEIEPGYPDWLNEFDTSEAGEIRFNVDPWEEENTREARVVVNYGEDSSSFRVVQEGVGKDEPDPGDEPIRLEIVEARPNTVIVSIETDGTLTYFINIEEKAVWDQYADDDEVFAHDMELFQWNADGWGISLEAWLREEFGTIKYATPYHMFMYVQDGARGTVYLENNTDYVVYAYGINGNGEILTDLYSVETTTTDFDLSNPVSFDIDIDITENFGSFRISPSDNGQQYFAGILLYRDEVPALEDLKADILRKREDQIFMYWSHPENPDTWEEIVEWMAFTGEQSVEEELGLADAPGVVYAYTIDDRGNMNGEMIIEEFRTNALEDSGNKIKMELSALTSRTATLTVTTTTNDLYLVMFDEDGSEYDGLEGKELANAILYADSDNLFSGRNNALISMKGMHRDVDYILVAFGYEAGQITTEPTVLRFTTPNPTVSDVTCKPQFSSEYYDLRQAFEKYPDVFRNPEGESRPVVWMDVELGGDPASFSYFLEFTENVQDRHVDDLITMLENHYNDLGPFGTGEWLYPFYGQSYTLVGVARDADGNYGEVFLSEPMVFSEEGCSPIDNLVIE